MSNAEAIDRAVSFASQAVSREPATAGYRNTLGLALYHAGSYREAIRSLQLGLHLDSTASPLDSLFLSMAHKKLGEEVEARLWYDRALAWFDQKTTPNPTHDFFRAQAAALFSTANTEQP